jgi:Cu+-exporting ATPase
MSVMVGLGRGARAGVLVKDAVALETLSNADVLLIDKTGTLTEGHPVLSTVESSDASALAGDEVLRLAAGLERASEHPLARAIVQDAEQRGLAVGLGSDFQSFTGQGAAARVENRTVIVGSADFLGARGVDVAPLRDRADELRKTGQTVVLVAIDGRLGGLIAVADPVKEGAREALDALRAQGFAVRMVTGDHAATAKAVAAKLGLRLGDGVDAGVTPEGKGEVVARLQAEGHRVAMAGDGINDAIALARADVGIAMGTGTDVAIASAGITLVKGDLRGLVRARKLSAATVRNIKENLFFAFAYNLVGVPVAAGILYPFFGILLSPMIAGAAMSLSSVSVIANALRLQRVDLDR